MSIFFVVFFFILGLFFGSFLNLIADRLSRGEKITGRSYCENCKKILSWKDLIPLLSFVWLRGKCRYCHSPLTFQYLFSELLTGFLFSLTFLYVFSVGIFNFQFSIFNEILNQKSLIINLLYYFFIVSSMVVIFFSDLRHGIIPDKIVFPAIIASLLFLTISTFYLPPSEILPSTLNHLLSGFGSFLFFLFLFLITKGKGMGFGDVKLSFLIGLILGLPGTIYSIYLAFLTGGVFAIILILWKKNKLKSQVPFGPFLVGNFFLVLFFQPQINRIILNLIR
ncbi:MAG: prepilin peptidase [Candidatus Levybacteria bacterium]|nr:prepilin peptidase [Candidatus Levybacteria bacterium]